MESIVRNVSEIDSAHRQALERMVGHALREDQRVIINVVNVDSEQQPSEEAPADDSQSAPCVPDWWNIYEGLTDEEIDRLDEAIRRRADLTRVFE